MIAATSSDGVLLVHVELEVRIPSAPAGQWDHARLGKLMETIRKHIQDTVDAAELVDAAERDYAKRKY